MLLAVMIAWPYAGEFLEEKDKKNLPKISIDHIDLDKKTVTNPKIVGVDGENQPYTITASSGEQIENDTVLLKNLKGSMTLKDGKVIIAEAQKGETTTHHAESVYFYDNVHITYDALHQAWTKDAYLDFKKGTIFGHKAIEGKGPYGVTSAQEFSFDYKKKILVLKGNAALTIFK